MFVRRHTEREKRLKVWYIWNRNGTSVKREENGHSKGRLKTPATDVDNFIILIINFIYALEKVLLAFKFL